MHTQYSALVESLLTGNDKIKRWETKGEEDDKGGEIIFEQSEVRSADDTEKLKSQKNKMSNK